MNVEKADYRPLKFLDWLEGNNGHSSYLQLGKNTQI